MPNFRYLCNVFPYAESPWGNHMAVGHIHIKGVF